MSISNPNRLRVLVLTHPDLVPPPQPTAAELRSAPWRAEFDVMQALARLGHEGKILGVYNTIEGIRRETQLWNPHIVFNLLEEFDGVATYDQNVVSFLELAGVPYTGCNPRGLMLARQKALAKMVLGHHGVRTPEFEVFTKGTQVRAPLDFRSPWFVKSLTEEGSLGISQESIVRTPKAFIERVRFVHDKVGSDVLAERYIEGRELYVGLLGNQRTETFPIWELKFRKAPSHIPRIATRRVKFDLAYQKKYGITSGRARGIDAVTEKRIQAISRRIYSALGLNGYGRMDMRLTAEGELYFLEANPNPHIGREEDFAQSALKAGIRYDELVDRILKLGLRWQPRRLAA